MGNLASIVNEQSRCGRCRASVRSICGFSAPVIHADIARISGRRFVAEGQTVLAAGGTAGLVGTVLAGVLKVSKTLPNGRERIVSLLYPGDFLGQLCFPAMNFAFEAATDVEICVSDRLAYEAY
jgi:CRP/FNR family transcriptional regulator